MLLAFAGFVYLYQRKRLDLKAASIYWIISGISLLGAILALIRTPNFELSLYNTAGMVIGMATMLLFIPTFSTPLARKAMLISQTLVGLAWMVEVQRLIDSQGVYTTIHFFGVDDKNRISMCMAMASTTLFSFAVLWKPNSPITKKWALLFRLAALVFGFYLIYTLTLTYSRSGLLTALLGAVAVIIVYALSVRGMISGCSIRRWSYSCYIGWLYRVSKCAQNNA